MIAILKFLIGLPMLIVGAELLIRGASAIARSLGISSLVIGLTVVAYGTSAPELAVTIGSVWKGEPDLGVGNVIGSNISNILLVLGLAASFAPLVVIDAVIRYNLPLMIVVSLLPLLMGWDGMLSRTDGLVLFLGALVYTIGAIRASRKATRLLQQLEGHAKPKPLGGKMLAWRSGQLLVGLGALTWGAQWLVDAATHLATWLGVSELVIGLTVVAVGTSLPEIATSVVAAMRGERDLAVGNAVGSNIFNILMVLGLTAAVSPQGLSVSPHVLRFDLPIMIAVAVASLPIFMMGKKLTRWEGLLFLGYFSAYTTILYLRANRQDHGHWEMLVLAVIVPLSLVVLSVLLGRCGPGPAPAQGELPTGKG